MIEFECTTCGKALKVGDEAAGKHGKCPKCGTRLRIPEPLPQNTFEKDEVRIEMVPPPPRLERGHVEHVPSVNVHLPRRTSSLGVASLVLGVVGFLLCWIPLIGILTMPISGLGLLLGGIGLVVAILRRGSGMGYPIAGIAVCGIAFAVGSLQVAAIEAAASVLSEAGRQANVTNQEIVTPRSSPGESRESPRTRSLNSRDTEAAQNPSASQPWASARNPVRQGEVQVRVTNVLIGKVPLKDAISDGETASQDDVLSIEVEVANLSPSKKVQYRTWNGADFSFSRDFSTLEDNFGNSYKRIDFGFSTEVIGQANSDSIYPGKSLRDVLVFEPPVDNVQFMDLELPASNFGGDGMLRLRVPAEMIRDR